jgi:hypothetical protein
MPLRPTSGMGYLQRTKSGAVLWRMPGTSSSVTVSTGVFYEVVWNTILKTGYTAAPNRMEFSCSGDVSFELDALDAGTGDTTGIAVAVSGTISATHNGSGPAITFTLGKGTYTINITSSIGAAGTLDGAAIIINAPGVEPLIGGIKIQAYLDTAATGVMFPPFSAANTISALFYSSSGSTKQSLVLGNNIGGSPSFSSLAGVTPAIAAVSSFSGEVTMGAPAWIACTSGGGNIAPKIYSTA